MSKVVNIKSAVTPDDLVTVKEFAQSERMKVATVYYRVNEAVKKGLIKLYDRGTNRFSRSRMLRILDGAS